MKTVVKRIFIIVSLLLLGVALALIAQAFMNMKTDTILVGLLLAPFVGYAVLSVGISEFEFGGFKAKLGKVASEKVEYGSGKIGPDLQALAEVGQEGIVILEEMLETYQLSEVTPIVMILKAGVGPYPRKETLVFIEKLSMYRSFKFVVIIDSKGRVSGYMPSWAARRVLGNPKAADEFLSVINNEGRFHELPDFRYIETDTLDASANNAEALRKMVEKKLDAHIVVDEEKQLVGVAERDRILARMMLSVVEFIPVKPSISKE